MKSYRPHIALIGIALLAVATVYAVGAAYQLPLHDIFTAAMPHAAGLLLAAGPVGVMERKSAGSGDDDGSSPGIKKVKELIEAQGQAWDLFKKTNDDRLKEIETKGAASGDFQVKIGKIDAELNKVSAELADILKKMQRPGASQAGEGKFTPEQLEHKQALGAYLRKGEDGGLDDLERKAMNTGSDPDGGFLVSAEMDAELDRVASAETSFRNLATVRNIGGASYKKMVKTRGVSGGWIGEQEDSAEGTGPQFVEIEIPAQRLYAEPWITNDMLEDADYDLESDITDEAGITFGEIEGNAFLNGDGIKKPRGLLTYPTVANANYAWGKLGILKTGVAGDFAASAPADQLISLQHALKQRYRNGAVFLMADGTLARVRQMKDGSGGYYLWQPDATAGFGGRLLGSPVEVDDYMPVIAASSLSIAFGNFKRAYTIVDRRGVAIIRDSVTKKGTTKFHLSKRVGGGVTNFEAYKALQFAV